MDNRAATTNRSAFPSMSIFHAAGIVAVSVVVCAAGMTTVHAASPVFAQRCEALVAWAGPLAELLHDGGVPDDPAELEPELLASWQADHESAERALGVLAGEQAQRDRIRRALLAELLELLEHPAVEERIARVADHLEAHGTLDATLFEDTA